MVVVVVVVVVVVLGRSRNAEIVPFYLNAVCCFAKDTQKDCMILK